jgi:DNA-binding Lrp family transcriptional regulator
MPYRELADRLDISVSAVHARIKTLIDSKVIGGFLARASPGYHRAIAVLIWGRTAHCSSAELFRSVADSDRTLGVFSASGRVAYVQGMVKGLCELDGYIAYVRAAAKLTDVRIGIESYALVDGKRASRVEEKEGELTNLDFRIISSLSTDCRKSAQDVAAEVGVSPRTVTRRLDSMLDRGMLELTLGWNPYQMGGLILTMVDIDLREGQDKEAFLSSLGKRFGPKVLMSATYHNLPGYVESIVWTTNIGELRDIVEGLENDPAVASAVPNVGITYQGYVTWMDKASEKMARK